MRVPRWAGWILVSLLVFASCDDPSAPDTSRQVASIVVSPATRTFTAVGDTARLRAEVRNPAGEPIAGVTIEWESLDTSTALVDGNGLVLAKAGGSTGVVARAGGKADTAVIVVAQEAVRLVVTPIADTLNAIGDTLLLTATATDANDVVILGALVSWRSLEPDTVSVESGVARSRRTGPARIVASLGSVSDTVDILSRQVPRSLTATADTLTILVGASRQVVVVAVDSNGVAIPASAFTWVSSPNQYATVSTSGVVTGIKPGFASVLAFLLGAFVEVVVLVDHGYPASPLSWTVVHEGLDMPNAPLVGLHARSSTDVMALASTGELYGFDGVAWRSIGGRARADVEFRDFWRGASTDVWAAGIRNHSDSGWHTPASSAYLARWTGSQWATEYEAPSGGELSAMWASASDDIWVAGSSLMRFNGSTWRNVAAPPGTASITALWGTSANDVYAGTSAGAIFHFDGATWTAASTADHGAEVTAIWGSSAVDVYAVDRAGWVRRWDGATWTRVHSSGGWLRTVSGTSANNVWIAGDEVLEHWDGSVWSRVPFGSYYYPAHVRRLWLGPSRNGWAVTADGVLLEHDGIHWTPHRQSRALLARVTGVEEELFVCGLPGAILRRRGAAWLTERLGHHSACADVAVFSASRALAVTGTSIVSHYDGAAWRPQPISSETFNFLHAVAVLSPSEAVALGHGLLGGILRYDGAAWHRMVSDQGGVAISVVSPSEAFIVGGRGGAARWDGTRWNAISAQTQADFVGVWAASGTDVFAAGNHGSDGVVYHFDGASWREVHRAPVRFLSIHGRSASEVYAVGDLGSIARFDGVSWRNETLPTRSILMDIWVNARGEVYVVGSPTLVLRGTR